MRKGLKQLFKDGKVQTWEHNEEIVWVDVRDIDTLEIHKNKLNWDYIEKLALTEVEER